MAITRWLVLLLVFISASPANADDGFALLSVQGVAQLKVPADQMEVDLSVVSEAPTATAALAENAELMRSVVKSLDELGLDKAEYRSGQFRIQPQWSSRPKNPPANWHAKIVGFTVTSPLHIKSKQKELIGALMNAVIEAGVNQVNSVRFSLSDARYYRQQALDTAVENAIEDAQTLARAAGVKLIEVQALTIDDTAITPLHIPREQLSVRNFVKAESAVLPFNPGEATVTARILLSYRIETVSIP